MAHCILPLGEFLHNRARLELPRLDRTAPVYVFWNSTSTPVINDNRLKPMLERLAVRAEHSIVGDKLVVNLSLVKLGEEEEQLTSPLEVRHLRYIMV